MRFFTSNLIFISLILVACNSKRFNQTRAVVKSQTNLKIKLQNGNWFNGNEFENKTVWINNGQLSFNAKSLIPDSVIDLEGKYVIPPFAEAHNHNLESKFELEKRINSYLINGVFYVKCLSSIKKRIDPLMNYYNHPKGLDISLAMAPLTASGGHPIELRQKYLESGYYKNTFNNIEELESHGFFTINNSNDLDRKWPIIISYKPDFIKVMLLYSEEYEKRRNDSSYFGNKGLNPELIPIIVKKAHQSNLRVSAHIETAYDFHVAVEAGVDEIAHLPEIDGGNLITHADAITAKKKGIVVVTTVSLVSKKKNESNYKALIENIKSNLNILKEAGVTMAVGSDMYNDNSVKEFQFLYDLGVFTPIELLKMWCENSATTTFPNRKIAKLKNGHEASFLVLDKNPLLNIRDVNSSINFMYKQGQLLNINDSKIK